MSLFVCDLCQTIENTAKGCFWGSVVAQWKDKKKNFKKLCSACTPVKYADGTPCRYGGKWHGLFPREQATVALIRQKGLHLFTYLGKFEPHFARDLVRLKQKATVP